MRTGSDRLAEIQGIFDARFNARLRSSLTSAVIEAVSERPLGPHDDQSARVVRALGNGPWAIARIVIGAEGNVVISEGAHTSYEEAMRQIFLKRVDALVSEWTNRDSEEQ